MRISTVPVGWEEDEDDPGCAYLLDEGDGRRICGAVRKTSPLRKAVSPYCPEHHALCHVAYGSEAEANRLAEVEAIAKAVGGRRSRYAVGPSGRFLKRLEQTARGFSRPHRS
jgi:hypothetical protein